MWQEVSHGQSLNPLKILLLCVDEDCILRIPNQSRGRIAQVCFSTAFVYRVLYGRVAYCMALIGPVLVMDPDRSEP